MKPELLLDARADLGEGPCWDAKSKTLFWVNIKAGEIHQFDPATRQDRIAFKGNEPVGCAVLAREGGMVAGIRNGIYRLSGTSNEATALCLPEAHLPGNRFNDGKCDPAGRLLAGTMDDSEKRASGALYSFAPDGSIKTLVSGVRISNGLAWSPDYGTLYYIDTPTRVVMAYEYDLETGDISHPREVVRIPDGLGWPDGMTSDREGNLWIALWGGASLTCWNPVTGGMIRSIQFPALNVTSCTFGGEKMDELFVTSAKIGMSAAQLAEYPFSGGLFHVSAGVEGMPGFKFGA